VAAGLGLDDAYFAGLGAPLERSRDRLAAGLGALGVPTLRCDGTYFLVLDVARWQRPDEDDLAFCKRLVIEAGVVLIPMSAFYDAAPPRSLVRACFCKQDATIDEALRRLGGVLR
jgi:aspartate/methionine/tyrosine aminotransferase